MAPTQLTNLCVWSVWSACQRCSQAAETVAILQTFGIAFGIDTCKFFCPIKLAGSFASPSVGMIKMTMNRLAIPPSPPSTVILLPSPVILTLQ